MMFSESKQRLYAALLFVGAGILLARTIIMLSQGALGVLVWWASGLLIFELIIDLACMMTSVNWFLSNDQTKDRIPLRLGAIAAIFHAFRVLIFVLGRMGPWIDFDVQPDQRALHDTRWTWADLYFATIMSILGLIAVIVIWRLRVGGKKKIK